MIERGAQKAWAEGLGSVVADLPFATVPRHPLPLRLKENHISHVARMMRNNAGNLLYPIIVCRGSQVSQGM